MALANTYSRRFRASNPDNTDVYQYEEVPEKVRVQIVSIVEDLFDYIESMFSDCYLVWQEMCKIIARDSGVRELRDNASRYYLKKYLDEDANLLGFLDFCDLFFKYLEEIFERLEHSYGLGGNHPFYKSYDQAIADLNTYFKEANFGYEYNNNQIISIDNQHIHKEIIKPVLQLLGDKRFQKIDDEYRLAHEHYRNKHVKDCVVACNRAFESMLKVICDLQQWEYKSGARASDLITLVRKNDLFLDDEAKNFDCFVATLKNGVPALRNNHGGHGGESDQPEPPLYMAQYLLNLTASNLMFLYQAWEIFSSQKKI